MAHTWSVAAMIYVLYTMLYIVLHHNSFCIEFSLSANRSRQFENITVRTADNDVAYPLLDKFELNVTNVLFGKMKSSFYGKQRGSTDPLGVMSIQHESQRLSARLRWLSNDELGITNMQAIFDSLPYVEAKVDHQKRLRDIVSKLQLRFQNYLQVLRTNKITVENLYRFHIKRPITRQYDCCSIPCNSFQSDSMYGCRINRHSSCDLVPPSVPLGSFNPGRNLTDVWQSNTQYFPSLKWQYFISIIGLHSEYPASSFRRHGDCSSSDRQGICNDDCQPHQTCHNAHDTRHRDIFLSTVQPQRKHVVIIMDHGNSMSSSQLHIAKAIVKHLIASFSENDRIGVIGLSSKATYPDSVPCLLHTLVPASIETRIHFNKFINSLQKQDAATNHSLGFLLAFDMIENRYVDSGLDSGNPMILYISRGLLSSLADARNVIDVVSTCNARADHLVIINTYAVIDDGKPVMYEKTFMQDVAYQNYAKYNVEYRLKTPVIRGIMMAVNSTQDLSSSVGRFYLPLNRTAVEDPVFSLPYMDEADGALTLSISQSCVHSHGNGQASPYPPQQWVRTEAIGVVGVDLNLEDVLQDVAHYTSNDDSRVFIVTSRGFTILHPSMLRPLRAVTVPMHTDIRHFERHRGFKDIRQAILSQEEGDMSLTVEITHHATADGQVIRVERSSTYYWKQVDDTPYIVVLTVADSRKDERVLGDIRTPKHSELVYHRLDLLPQEDLCLHLKQLSTLKTSAVFLAPSCFVRPFEHLVEQETKRSVQSYLAFLKDDTRLITNPGLKKNVRGNVVASSRISMEWVRRYGSSKLNNYVIRRYIGMPTGVLSMYPGTLLDKYFEPTQSAWYRNALRFPGRVTLTAPYVDAGGAGYIVTVGHTVFEGKPTALHSPSDRVVAVMGMDITLGYFHKLLYDLMPACKLPSVSCFLMDEAGYVIAHPGLIDPMRRGPVERSHITHIEPLIANDMLNHKHFVRKRLCNRYTDRTVLRHFDFNTSFWGALTNMVHGEHCAQYQVAHVVGTNTFLGIVNHTCRTAAAFCPCSMFDRLCLNCKRMEQAECECPCECPLDFDLCTGDIASTDDWDCLGVLSCQWCQVESDDLSMLKSPYCASQQICFGGVLSAASPYGDEIGLTGVKVLSMRSTPVGPVAGGIMGCFLLLALFVYCYRHRRVSETMAQYMNDLPDNVHCGSHMYEDDGDGSNDFSSAGHTNILLAAFDNHPANISPYRVNTAYRRPAVCDSDHGYSTMTPHDDSEHASMPCLDRRSVGKDHMKPPYSASCAPTSTPANVPLLSPPPSSKSRSRSSTPPHTRPSNPTHPAIREQMCAVPEGDTALPGATLTGQAIDSQDVSVAALSRQPHHIMASIQVHVVDSR